MTFRIHTNHNHEQPFRFTIVAGNNKILATSETYHNLEDCRHAITVILLEAPDAEIKYSEPIKKD